MSYIQFFRDANHDANELDSFLSTCCEMMTYEFIPNNNIVFNFGEKGQKFYIILKGQIEIFIPKNEAEIKREIEELQAKTQASDKRNAPPIKKQEQILPPNYYTNGVLKFRGIKTLGAGFYFGELALTNDKPRAATILATEDTHFVSLTKKDYKAIFDTQINKMKAKLEFFSNLFEGCSMESIVKFSYSFYEKHCRYGQKIFSQGDMPTELHLIKVGEVQVNIQKIMKIHCNNFIRYQQQKKLILKPLKIS